MKNKIARQALYAALGLASIGVASADLGNRYGLPQIYHSEISAAEANLMMKHMGEHGGHHGKKHQKPVIIDVRRISEYVAGHPPKAYNIPFPHVDGSANQPNDATGYIGYDLSGNPDICFVPGCDDGTNNDGTLLPSDFVDYVQSLFPDKNTPILTLCRTGYRSVQAANLLTRAGYTNVRNIWEGFVGQPKYVYDGGAVRMPLEQLDLNHDSVFDDADKDGWAGFQGLPTSTKIKRNRIFSPYSDLY